MPSEPKRHLTLIVDNTPTNDEQMYSTMFSFLADVVADAKSKANDLMIEVLDKDINRARLECDYSLVELDLAELDTNLLTLDGEPRVNYIDPDLESGLDLCDECSPDLPPAA